MPTGFFKTTAALAMFVLSFVVLVDAFVCNEAAAGEESTPVECCVQCCPRHHLVPRTAILDNAFSESPFEKFPVLKMNPPLFHFVKSIFHPPKLPLI